MRNLELDLLWDSDDEGEEMIAGLGWARWHGGMPACWDAAELDTWWRGT